MSRSSVTAASPRHSAPVNCRPTAIRSSWPRRHSAAPTPSSRSRSPEPPTARRRDHHRTVDSGLRRGRLTFHLNGTVVSQQIEDLQDLGSDLARRHRATVSAESTVDSTIVDADLAGRNTFEGRTHATRL